ncbi:protein NRT1/ PTR FAMILY 5.5-like [Salvia splendens]|uniref:protein NRT1/ PTR FAMILY 5.5-like n=1 Tax=Salvia splendens TaxID=180675 RepID=UPI001C26737E|nr:protein NRT1/ PTR FAMILY 5.5-like [Salvia splendens]
MPGEIRRSGSWKLCSVSEVESDKALICLAPIMCCFIMCGVVHSTGNTYFLEQASHMKLNIGKWKPPLQLMLLISAFFKSSIVYLVKVSAPAKSGDIFTVYSVVCCAVAAGVEKRRIKVLRKHNLLDLPDDGKVPMSAWWLTFQFGLAGMMEPFSEWGFAALLEELAPKSIKRYHDCLVEGGGGKNWFQFTLNQSRLDRYYWVLTALCGLNVYAYLIVIFCIYGSSRFEMLLLQSYSSDDEGFHDYEIWNIKKGSAVDLI